MISNYPTEPQEQKQHVPEIKYIWNSVKQKRMPEIKPYSYLIFYKEAKIIVEEKYY